MMRGHMHQYLDVDGERKEADMKKVTLKRTALMILAICVAFANIA